MKKEKTVLEWLSLTPKQARDNAIENIKKEGNNPLMIETPTLQMALKGSFNWSNSKQGFDYWVRVIVDYRDVMSQIKIENTTLRNIDI